MSTKAARKLKAKKAQMKTQENILFQEMAQAFLKMVQKTDIYAEDVIEFSNKIVVPADDPSPETFAIRTKFPNTKDTALVAELDKKQGVIRMYVGEVAEDRLALVLHVAEKSTGSGMGLDEMRDMTCAVSGDHGAGEHTLIFEPLCHIAATMRTQVSFPKAPGGWVCIICSDCGNSVAYVQLAHRGEIALTFTDVEKMNEEHPGTFSSWPREDRASLRIGDLAKIAFEMEGLRTERMWVKVTGLDGENYLGALDNNPASLPINKGDIVKFGPENICDIYLQFGPHYVTLADYRNLLTANKTGPALLTDREPTERNIAIVAAFRSVCDEKKAKYNAKHGSQHKAQQAEHGCSACGRVVEGHGVLNHNDFGK